MRLVKYRWRLYLVVVVVAVAISGLGSRMVTLVSTYTQSPVTTLILDPGHGGEDGGAVSVTGVPESQINLEISRRLKDLLELSGYRVIMLRSSDTALYSGNASTYSQKKISDLKNRVETINSTPNAVLISIHQNNFSDSKYRGAQVFYAASDASKALAQTMQSVLAQTLDETNHREIKKASGIYLMEHIQCPGILIECGFLSNSEEEALLRTDEYQKKLSKAIASAVSGYLKQETAQQVSAINVTDRYQINEKSDWLQRQF